MKRTLRLRRETLAPLTDAQLAHVAGGAPTHPIVVCTATCWDCPTVPVNTCFDPH